MKEPDRFGNFTAKRSAWTTTLVTDEFEVIVFHLGNEIDIGNYNVDVQVRLGDGRVFVAMLATLADLRGLMDSYRHTGECAGGTYIWASDLVIVRSLANSSIVACVKDLIETEEIESAMSLVPEEDLL